MLLAVLAWAVTLGCVLSAGRRSQQLARAVPLASERQAALAEELQGASDALIVARWNEEIGDVARLVEVTRDVPRAAARIALFSGGSLALFELARQLSGNVRLEPAAAAISAGFVGYFACSAIGRRAKARGDELRESWNRAARRLPVKRAF